jgi:hypothetical protein
MTEDALEVLKRNRRLLTSIPKVQSEEERRASETVLRSRNLLASNAKAEKGRELLELLPQGPGSGLDADMVDGLHAAEIVAKATARGGGGGGGGSGACMVKHGNEWHTKQFAEACCQVCTVDELPEEVAGHVILLSTDEHLYVGIEGTGNPCGCVFPVVDELPELAPGEVVLLSVDGHLYVGV